MTTIDVIYYDDEEEVTLTLPAKMVVCSDCRGCGTVLCEGMRGHAYSQEEFEEAFFDEEDREAYCKRGGKYDVTCPTCDGKNVVPVIDTICIPSHLKASYKKYVAYKRESDQDEAEYQSICRMERMSGC